MYEKNSFFKQGLLGVFIGLAVIIPGLSGAQIAIIFKLLSALIAMNIPYLTDVLQDVVQIVKATPGLEKVQSLTKVETQIGDQPVEVIVMEPKEETNGTKSN